MDSQQQQASERIRQANNILVTVSSNPSVDQLAACIGLTISLNKMGKHATAVFSGNVPSTLEFLQPEKTIEKNTDSLRDFIIALDKSKADKLRYKVEDRVVKIFITPYRTSITDKDLEFSQGDFNVDVIVTLGVHNQEELDLAITSHGRILHDATVITLNTRPGGELGSINWLNPNASSLSELAVQLVNSLDKTLVDGQVATSFLTGIVSETERFSNNKTTPQTMSISAQLMSSGANQQLVATKLEEPVASPPAPAPSVPIAAQTPDENNSEPAPVKKSSDGTLEITHDETKSAQDEEAEEDREEAVKTTQKPDEEKEAPAELPMPTPQPPQIHIDEHGALSPVEQESRHEDDEDLLPPVSHREPSISHHSEPPKMVIEPPAMGGELAATAAPGAYKDDDDDRAGGLPSEEGARPTSMDDDVPSVGPTIMPPTEEDEPINAPGTSFLGDQPLEDSQPATDDTSHVTMADEAGKTLSEIEQDVHAHAPQPESTPPNLLELPVSPNLNSPEPSPINVVPPTGPDLNALTPPNPPAPQPVDPIVSAFHNPSTDTMLPPLGGPVPAGPAPLGGNDTPDALSVPDMPIPNASPERTPAAQASFDLNKARDAVAQAMSGNASEQLEPIQGLNAQPVDLPSPSDNGPTAFSTPPAPAGPSTPDLTLPAAPVVQPWTPTPEPPAPAPVPGIGVPGVGQQPPAYGNMPPAPVFVPQGSQPPAFDAFQTPGAPPTAPPPMLPPTPR